MRVSNVPSPHSDTIRSLFAKSYISGLLFPDTSAIPPPPSWSPKSRGNSASSKCGENNVNNKQPPENHRRLSPNRDNHRPPTPTKPKPVKPKPANLRIREEHPGDTRKKANSFTSKSAVTTPSTVRNRAKMFDLSGDGDASQDSNKS